MARLGIVDWGIGGISILKLITQQGGELSATYFSDTGVTPYGKMSRRELVGRLNAVIRFLCGGRGVTHLAIGCNAACTALPDLIAGDLRVIGVIEPAVKLAAGLRPQRLGLIGGRRTVLSGEYRGAFARHGIDVHQRIAQPLSGMIESGDTSSDELNAACQRILAPLKNSSHILMACTHYPAIESVLRQYVSAETVFIDPASAMIDAIKTWGPLPMGRTEYLTSGDTQKMKLAARAAFDWNIPQVEKIGRDIV
jgi:glutamate racemase